MNAGPPRCYHTMIAVLILQGVPTIETLKSSGDLDAQLVISEYVVRCDDKSGEGKLIRGHLHIRTPQGMKSPKVTAKQRIATDALQRLDKAAYRSVIQPAVRVLLGDPNLKQSAADVICQNKIGEANALNSWYTQTSDFQEGGDVLGDRGIAGGCAGSRARDTDTPDPQAPRAQ